MEPVALRSTCRSSVSPASSSSCRAGSTGADGTSSDPGRPRAPAGASPSGDRPDRRDGRAALEAVARDVLVGGAVEVAPRLLNLLLVHGATAGRVVEVEAYLAADDAASHAFHGRTRRNASMYGRPGLLYVYVSHGIHPCANVVCDGEGTAAAVLVRALEPVAGLEEMRRRRPASRSDDELCAGPGRLCAALGIGTDHDGTDLLAGRHGVRLLDDGTPPPEMPLVGPRIGIGARAGAASDLRWRFGVEGSPSLSRPFGGRQVTGA